MKTPKAVEPSRREESTYQRLVDAAVCDLMFSALGRTLLEEIRLAEYVPSAWKRDWNHLVHHRGR